MLFGLRQRDTGLTKYPVRNRQRVITYAITVALQKYDPDFIQSLKSHLFKLYPLFRELNGTTVPAAGDMIHLYFSSKQTYAQWIPFAITIFMLFFYVYFSCKRIEFVKSKLGIALSAIGNQLINFTIKYMPILIFCFMNTFHNAYFSMFFNI